MPSKTLFSAKRIPVPMHYQDTPVHCGLACAMMILDWLKRGAFTRPPGHPPGAMSQLLMHEWMDQRSPEGPSPVDARFWTAPSQLRMLINESPVRSTILSPLRAQEITGTREAIQARIDRELEDGRPVVVHTASTETNSGHWVVVIGRSPILPGAGVGYFILNPRVFGADGAYSEQTNPETLCFEIAGQSASRSFVHTRGHACVCPNWNGENNRAIGEEFLPQASMDDRIWWGSVPTDQTDACHAVVLTPRMQLPKVPQFRLPLKPPRPFDAIKPVEFDPVRFRVDAVSRLKSFSLLGRSAPAPWKRAFVDAAPTVLPIRSPSGRLVLSMWPESDQGSRVAALWTSTGHLHAAAILRNWPEFRPPAAFAQWFRRHARRLCAPLDLEIEPKSASITVDEDLYWKACESSMFPWWPFYVVRLGSAAGSRAVKVHVDAGGRVHSSLRAPQRRGG